MHELFTPFIGTKIAMNYWDPAAMDVATLVQVTPTWFAIKTPSGRLFTYPYASVFSLFQPPAPIKAGTGLSEKTHVQLLVNLNVSIPKRDVAWAAFNTGSADGS